MLLEGGGDIGPGYISFLTFIAGSCKAQGTSVGAWTRQKLHFQEEEDNFIILKILLHVHHLHQFSNTNHCISLLPKFYSRV